MYLHLYIYQLVEILVHIFRMLVHKLLQGLALDKVHSYRPLAVNNGHLVQCWYLYKGVDKSCFNSGMGKCSIQALFLVYLIVVLSYGKAITLVHIINIARSKQSFFTHKIIPF